MRAHGDRPGCDAIGEAGVDALGTVRRHARPGERHHVCPVPEEACEDAWGGYIRGSLHQLIATGVGSPDSNPDEVTFAEAAAG